MYKHAYVDAHTHTPTPRRKPTVKAKAKAWEANRRATVNENTHFLLMLFLNIAGRGGGFYVM